MSHEFIVPILISMCFFFIGCTLLFWRQARGWKYTAKFWLKHCDGLSKAVTVLRDQVRDDKEELANLKESQK